MAIGAATAAWHYIFGGGGLIGVAVGLGRAHGWRQRDAGGAQRQARGRSWRASQHEALAVLLDLGLGQRVEISDDFRPRAVAAERGDVVLERLLQHQREEAAEHVAADRLITFVEDRPRGEHVLGGSKSLLYLPEIIAARARSP